jgi:hypothetical protein
MVDKFPKHPTTLAVAEVYLNFLNRESVTTIITHYDLDCKSGSG